jgi:hypothetical protein
MLLFPIVSVFLFAQRDVVAKAEVGGAILSQESENNKVLSSFLPF